MNTHDIELPPLPEAVIVSYQTDSTMRRMELRTYSDKDMKDYARAAVEADRKRRREPTAAEISDVVREITGCPDIKSGEKSLVVALGMLFHTYAAPQPADDFEKQRSRIEESMRQGARLTNHRLKLDAPQPAEPVGEVLGETCIDGGKCHHGCKERCFRRQCCEPFSDYSGPWEYAAETDSPQPAEPIVSDVEAIVRLLESREWAEHVATTPLGQRLETAVTVLVGAVPQPAEPVSQHPDDAAVDAFAAAMKAKLAKKRGEGRGGWRMCSAGYLSRLLREHVEKGDPVDVANLAMMLHQNGQRIEPAEPMKVPSDVLAHAIWAAAQTSPGEGIEDAVERVAALLARYGKGTP